jgi:preprotein translocase subunit SecD
MLTRTLWYKTIFILLVVLGCLYGIMGLPRSRAELLENMQRRIRLGLDLKGGSHLVLEVQVQDAIRAQADQVIEQLRTELNRQGIAYTSLNRNDPQSIAEADNIQITVGGLPPERSRDFRALIDDRFLEWVYTAVDSSTWRLTMRPAVLAQIKAETVTQSIQTIENRVNGLGLTEPTIQQHGRADAQHQILVQLPGVDDPARVREILQTTALLEMREVRAGPYGSVDEALAAHGGVLPENSEILPYTERVTGQAPAERWYIVARTPVVTGRDLRNARETQDPAGRGWSTSFSLSVEAGQRFGRFTEANIGNNLAVVLDRRIRSVAVIRSRIEDQGQIDNLRSQQEASDLALVLRAGSLPASVLPLEERTVGPSLGADSIRQGLISGLAGLTAVVIFMLVYYRGAGINAVVALFLNVVLLMACLSYFGATLTLPGIAGIILTIGMAVDSNVLIFERIREELRAGKSVVAAVDAGFGKAFLTIIDTNLTTIIAAAFLFLFGTGPVRGFAVTLSIGLIANLFTAVFVSRVIFDWILSRQQQVTELSI